MSDHPFRPLGLPGPRPRKWSLTPRCLCLSRRGSSSGRVRPGGHRRSADPRREQRPSRSDCAARNSRAQGAARCSRSASPMLRMAVGLDRATRRPVSGLLSTAAAEVLDDDERRRYCLIIFAGCELQPLHIARCGARSNRRSQATVRSPSLQFTSWSSVRAMSRPRIR